jgi:hypothetical protein
MNYIIYVIIAIGLFVFLMIIYKAFEESLYLGLFTSSILLFILYLLIKIYRNAV